VSCPFCRIDFGRLHPALTRLEDAGLIHSEHEPQPDPTRVARRLYTLTAAGALRAQTPIGASR